MYIIGHSDGEFLSSNLFKTWTAVLRLALLDLSEQICLKKNKQTNSGHVQREERPRPISTYAPSYLALQTGLGVWCPNSWWDSCLVFQITKHLIFWLLNCTKFWYTEKWKQQCSVLFVHWKWCKGVSMLANEANAELLRHILSVTDADCVEHL